MQRQFESRDHAVANLINHLAACEALQTEMATITKIMGIMQICIVNINRSLPISGNIFAALPAEIAETIRADMARRPLVLEGSGIVYKWQNYLKRQSAIRLELMRLTESISASNNHIFEAQSEPFNLVDLPLEIFAAIAKMLPERLRGVCRAFREFVPVRRAIVSKTSMHAINQIDAKYFRGTGPIHIKLEHVSEAAVAAAAKIAQQRELHLHIEPDYVMIEKFTSKLVPTSLNVHGFSNVEFIQMDRLCALETNHANTLVHISRSLLPSTPLKTVKVPEVLYGYAGGRLICSTAPITVSSRSLRTLVRAGMHFQHPPIVTHMTPKYYRRLRRHACRDLYKSADLKLTGRGKFEMYAPDFDYADRSWCTVHAK